MVIWSPGTRFAREDRNPGAGEHECVRFTLYTVDAPNVVWRPQKLAPFT